MDGPKKRSQNYARTKGHTAEQLYAKRFREMGFEFCRTSREASDLLDSCGIDLCFIPINPQIKSGFKRNRPNAKALFSKIKEDLKKRFPPADPVHKLPRVLIHKDSGYTAEGELVTMTWDDWVEMFKAWALLNGHIADKRVKNDMQESSPSDNICSS